MLRLLIVAALLYGAYWLASSLKTEYKKVEERNGDKPGATAPVVTDLPGMPPQLGPSLQTAEQSGPATLKKWIAANRHYLADPKLGDIELDYAVAVARVNSAEARETYRAVRDRTPPNSPLQARLKRLSASFE